MTDQTPPPNVPPSTTPAGWYPDPITGQGLRWWNGTEWTDQVAGEQPGAMHGSPPSEGLGSLGDWINETFSVVTRRGGHIFTLFVVTLLPVTLLVTFLLWVTIRDIVILDLDDSVNGPRVEGFEASSLIGLGIGLVANVVATILFIGAVSRQVDLARQDEPETWSDSLLQALARTPRIFGTSILVGLLFTLLTIVVVLVSALGIAVFAPLLIVVIPAAIVAFVIVWVRTSLAVTAASVGPKGESSIRSSIKITKGKAMAVFGRLMMLMALAFAISLVGSAISAPISAFGGGETFDPEQTTLAIRDLLGSNVGAFAFVQVINGVLSAASTALWAGGSVILYRRLGGGSGQ